MADTIPQSSRRGRHLSAVNGMTEAIEAGRAAQEHHAEVTRLTVSYAAERPTLNRAGQLRLDQAELFLLSLDNEMLTADSLRSAYLLGLAESHLAGLIDLIRSVAA